MKNKSLKIPAIIISIALILAVVAHFVTSVCKKPTITEQDFNYSIMYKLNGETKTMEGIYKCTYEGYSEGEDPHDRYYNAEYIVDGQTTLSHSYTIAEKDGAKLYIVTVFNEYYLMGDKKNMDYEPFLEEPYLEAVDKEGYPYDETNMPSEFTAEIVSWEYPEPIENKFTFEGFAMMHSGSMVAMLVVGLLTILAGIIFAKKEKSLTYDTLDIFSIVLNAAICVLGIPFITITSAFFQLTMSTDSFFYQLYMCVPALTAFAVAASIALRRKGFRMAGFLVQFVGPVIYIIPLIIEAIVYNFFG
jgi:hypothetical protein